MLKSHSSIKFRRVALALTLVLVLLVLCIYHQMNHLHHKEYPLIKDIVANYPVYLNESVALFGKVVDADKGSFNLLLHYARKKEVIFSVLSEVSVQEGDRVEVLGTLGPDYRVTAEKIIVYKNWKYHFISIRSALAIPLLLFILLRNWRVDIRQLRLIRGG